MPKTCTICLHPKRREIESKITAKVPLRNIALSYATTPWSLNRHLKKCMGKALDIARQQIEAKSGKSILEQLHDIQRRTMAIIEKAGSDKGTLLKAVAECRKNLELMAKLTGELDTGTKINVLVMPEWVGLRDRIIDALAPYPDARGAVVAAIGGGD